MLKKKRINFRLTQSTRFSKSVRDLAIALRPIFGYKVFRTTELRPDRRQINYGRGVNKLEQFKLFKELDIPALEYTTDKLEAMDWGAKGFTVFGRKYLSSSCGKGIEVYEPGDVVGTCPVYTKYKKKKREFRAHVFQGTVVAIVEKMRKRGFEGQRDTKIRNLANGYVFVQQTVNLPEGIQALAIRACGVVQSDFAGVDIGYNEKNNELFVIEVNSAPGIVGANIGKYAEEIKRKYK